MQRLISFKSVLVVFGVGVMGILISSQAYRADEEARQEAEQHLELQLSDLDKEQQELEKNLSEIEEDFRQESSALYKQLIPVIETQLSCVSHVSFKNGKSYWVAADRKVFQSRFTLDDVRILRETTAGQKIDHKNPRNIDGELYIPIGDSCLASVSEFQDRLFDIKTDNDAYTYSIIFLRDRYFESRLHCAHEHINDSLIVNYVGISYSVGRPVNSGIFEHLANILGCNGRDRLGKMLDIEGIGEFDYTYFFYENTYFLIGHFYASRSQKPSLMLAVYGNPEINSKYFEAASRDVSDKQEWPLYEPQNSRYFESENHKIYGKHELFKYFDVLSSELKYKNDYVVSPWVEISTAWWFVLLTWLISLISAILLSFILFRRWRQMSEIVRQEEEQARQEEELARQEEYVKKRMIKIQGVARCVDPRDHSYGSGESSGTSSFSSGSSWTDYKYYLSFKLEESNQDGGVTYRSVKLCSEDRPFTDIKDGDNIIVGFVDSRVVGVYNLSASSCVYARYIALRNSRLLTS